MVLGWIARSNDWKFLIERRGKELGLEAVDESFEFDQVKFGVLLLKSCLELLTNFGMFQ